MLASDDEDQFLRMELRIDVLFYRLFEIADLRGVEKIGWGGGRMQWTKTSYGEEDEP